MHEQGFIKLYRKFIDWEWYTDKNTKSLFVHCLLKANHTEKKWRGKSIKRGTFITSLDKLKTETGLSKQEVRTAIRKLESTNDITSKSTNKNRLITVTNYNDYQVTNTQPNIQATFNQQASNIQSTPTKELKELKNDKNDKNKQYNSLALKHYENEELNSLFIDFLKLRKKLKAQNTERAINTLKNKIKHLTKENKMECINESIMNSWKGLFPNNFSNTNNSYKSKHNKNTIKDDIQPDWLNGFVNKL